MIMMIIDEINMISTSFLTHINKKCQDFRCNTLFFENIFIVITFDDFWQFSSVQDISL